MLQISMLLVMPSDDIFIWTLCFVFLYFYKYITFTLNHGHSKGRFSLFNEKRKATITLIKHETTFNACITFVINYISDTDSRMILIFQVACTIN